MLKNFKDAFEAGDTTWISKNIGYIDTARTSVVKNNAIVAFQGTQADMLRAMTMLTEHGVCPVSVSLCEPSLESLFLEAANV